LAAQQDPASAVPVDAEPEGIEAAADKLAMEPIEVPV